MEKNHVQDIQLISTGGTIEKSYSESDGSLKNRDSFIRQTIVERLRLPYTRLHIMNIINKDSLYFTDYDRNILVKTIKSQLEKEIPLIVLHGTDTMAKSAQYVYSHLNDAKDLTVPIIFTGAMKPMGFVDSDAFQNVTESLYAAKIVGPGIYISFHGQLFKVPGVRKNHAKRTFEYTDE